MFQKQKIKQLLIGIIAIYSIYFLASLIQQRIIKYPYVNVVTDKLEKLQYPLTIIIVPTFVAALFGYLRNIYYHQDGSHIPQKNFIKVSSLILISSLSYIVAIIYTSYPMVTMIKSCNILSVIMVAVFCSKVRDKRLKLGSKKLISGTFATIGLIIYNLFSFNNQSKDNSNLSNFVIGLILLLISLIADGFVPDFQASIKSNYNASPWIMFYNINKWVSILATIFSLVNKFQFFDIIQFMIQHPLFNIHLLLMSSMSTIGQIFIYRMIKQFKQHIVPFVITTRKIFTALISIFYYHHSTNLIQLLGISIVFISVTVQFIIQVKQKQIPKQINKQPIQLEQQSTSIKIEDSLTDQSINKIQSNQN